MTLLPQPIEHFQTLETSAAQTSSDWKFTLAADAFTARARRDQVAENTPKLSLADFRRFRLWNFEEDAS